METPMGKVRSYFKFWTAGVLALTLSVAATTVSAQILDAPNPNFPNAASKSYLEKGLQAVQQAQGSVDYQAVADSLSDHIPGDKTEIEHATYYNAVKTYDALKLLQNALSKKVPGTDQYMYPAMYQQLAQPVQQWEISNENGQSIKIPIFSDAPINLQSANSIYHERPYIKGYQNKRYYNGNDVNSIADQMIEDYIEDELEFHLGVGNWHERGLCWNNNPAAPEYSQYQAFWFPSVYGEITEDPLTGEFLPNDDDAVTTPSGGQLSTREFFVKWLRDGKNAATDTDVDNIYKTNRELAPYDINRGKALGTVNSNNEIKSPNDRNSDHKSSVGSKGSIPDAPQETEKLDPNPYAFSFGEGFMQADYGLRGRSIEFHRFNSLASSLGLVFWPGADPNCMDRPNMPLNAHRSDNPLYYAFTRSTAYADLLMQYMGKQHKFMVGDAIGSCIGYDLKNSAGAPSGPKNILGTGTGLLKYLNPSGGLMGQDSRDNCMQEAGSIYPLSHLVQNNKYFQANFFLQMIRSTKLTRYIGDYYGGGVPSFHRWDAQRGDAEHFASLLQLKRGSFVDGSNADPNFDGSPRVISDDHDDWYKHLWQTDPADYNNSRGKPEDEDDADGDGYPDRDWHRGVWLEWHYVHACCHPGHVPTPDSEQTQILGSENFDDDGW